jgi:ADP-heptose:LPS heptosyltransferase
MRDAAPVRDPAARAPFMETAGVLHHLDLLIACDSGSAHIAGALGACPVWVLLNFFFDAR